MGDKVAKLLGGSRRSFPAGIRHDRQTYADTSSSGAARAWRPSGSSTASSTSCCGGSPRHLAIVQSVPGLAGAAGERVLARGRPVRGRDRRAGFCRGRAPSAVRGDADRRAAVDECRRADLRAAAPAVARGSDSGNLAFLSLRVDRRRCALAGPLRARLRRHPVSDRAHLEDCLTLTYALPPRVLRRFCRRDSSSRPSAATASSPSRWSRRDRCARRRCPTRSDSDFFLAGYRVFTHGSARRRTHAARPAHPAQRRRPPVDGRRRQSVHALQLSPLRRRGRSPRRSHHACASRRADDSGDLDVTADLTMPRCRPDRRFAPLREARRFAGPLPFTFDYEPETASPSSRSRRRATTWRPAPVRSTCGTSPSSTSRSSAGARRSSPRRFMSPTSTTAGSAASATRLGEPARRWHDDARRRVRSSASTGRSTQASQQPRSRSSRWRSDRHGASRSSRRAHRRDRTDRLWIVASLVASWIVYDRSPLMRWEWIRRALGFAPRRLDQHPCRARRIDAGAAAPVRPGSRPGLRHLRPGRDDGAVDRARQRRLARSPAPPSRRLSPPAGGDRHRRRRPAAALGARAAHRRDARAPCSPSCVASSAPAARVVVAEHLRDWANFAGVRARLPAFSFAAHLDALLRAEPFADSHGVSVTPFVRVFVLRRLP